MVSNVGDNYTGSSIYHSVYNCAIFIEVQAKHDTGGSWRGEKWESCEQLW